MPNQITSFPIDTTELAGVPLAGGPADALLCVDDGNVAQTDLGIINYQLSNNTIVSDEISNVLCVADDGSDVYQTDPADVVSAGLTPQASGNWKYIKLANGLCVLWTRETISSVAVTTSSGNIFKAAADTEVSYPFTVYDAVANVSIAGSGTSTYMFWAAHVTPWQGKVNFRAMSSQSITLDVLASITVYGRWK